MSAMNNGEGYDWCDTERGLAVLVIMVAKLHQ
jgi:hypothetical protein